MFSLFFSKSSEMFKSLRYFWAVISWPFISLLPNTSIGYICWFSKEFFDVHDHRGDRGGDGVLTHFHEYTCWNCGKKFMIRMKNEV
jgi:hypothetical protein